MRPVTVITFGRLRITKLGNFAVESFKIGFGYIIMAMTTLLDDIKSKILLVGP